MKIVEWTFAVDFLADFDYDGAAIFIAVWCDDGWRSCGKQFIPMGEIATVGFVPAIDEMIKQILTDLATAPGLTRSR